MGYTCGWAGARAAVGEKEHEDDAVSRKVPIDTVNV